MQVNTEQCSGDGGGVHVQCPDPLVGLAYSLFVFPSCLPRTTSHKHRGTTLHTPARFPPATDATSVPLFPFPAISPSLLQYAAVTSCAPKHETLQHGPLLFPFPVFRSLPPPKTSPLTPAHRSSASPSYLPVKSPIKIKIALFQLSPIQPTPITHTPSHHSPIHTHPPPRENSTTFSSSATRTCCTLSPLLVCF